MHPGCAGVRATQLANATPLMAKIRKTALRQAMIWARVSCAPGAGVGADAGWDT